MKRTHGGRRARLLSAANVAILAIFIVSERASAQENGSTSQTDQTHTARTAGVEQVVVTARRRTEQLSKVPVAVVALGAAQLRSHSITKETDLQSSVAGLTVKAGSSQNQLNYAVRGQTLDSFSGSRPGVLPYLNDVALATQTATTFYDLSSVQVLKGPQGTLFGRNATGGAVLYNTTPPSDTLSGYATVRGGSYDMREFQGAVNIPIIPGKVDLRVAGDDNQENGYVKNLTSGGTLGDTDAKSFRASVRILPTDQFINTTVLQYGSYGGTELDPGLYSYNKVGEVNNGYALEDTAALLFSPGGPFWTPALAAKYPGGIAGELARQQALGPYKVALEYSPGHYSRDLYLEDTSTYNLTPDILLKNIASYSTSTTRTDVAETGAPSGVLDLLNYPNTRTNDGIRYGIDQWSEEFQVQGKAFDHQLNYILGGYAANESDSTDIPVVVGLGLPTILQHFHYDGVNADYTRAVFAQATYDLSQLTTVKGLSFTLGGRETWETLTLSQLAPSINFGAPTQALHEQAPSWQIGLEWQVNPHLLVYAVNRGSWRAGNINVTTTPINNANEFAPEYTHDYELGTKFNGTLLDKPTSVDLAIYEQQVTGVQRDIYFQVNGQPSSLTSNVPKAVIKGVELDGQIRLLDYLLVGGSAAYTSAVYTNGNVTIFGQTLPFSSYQDTPKWSGDLYGQVTLPTPEAWGGMSLRGDIYYQTRTFFTSLDETIAPGTELPNYALVNFRYEWDNIFGSAASFAFYGKNLLNRTYYLGGNGLGPDVGFNTAVPGSPRQLDVELSYKF